VEIHNYIDLGAIGTGVDAPSYARQKRISVSNIPVTLESAAFQFANEGLRTFWANTKGFLERLPKPWCVTQQSSDTLKHSLRCQVGLNLEPV
jgi:hypothetical protein